MRKKQNAHVRQKCRKTGSVPQLSERGIHDAFSAYLRKEGLSNIHHRMDKKSGIQVGWPDFTICHVGRCLMVEIKTPKGETSIDQDRVFSILRKAGNIVEIARSVEQAVSAVQTWLGVEKAAVEPPAQVIEPSDLWIGTLFGTDYVFRGQFSAGSTAEKVRRATPEDIRNLPRK